MMTMMAMLALKGTVILVAAASVSRLLSRASASLRHLIWTAALVAVAALPVFEATGFRLEVGVPASWVESSGVTAAPTPNRPRPP